MLKFKLQSHYLLTGIVLFIIELIIGVYIHDTVIRPFAGDFLVVILIYCLLKSFIILPANIAAISVLLFSYIIEILQYLHILNHLGLASSSTAKILLGTSFSWIDILMYSLGVSCVWLTDRYSNISNLKINVIRK